MSKNGSILPLENSPAKQFNSKKIILPIVIGLGVIAWLFASELEVDSFKYIHFTWKSVGYIILAFLFIFGRDFGLIWRFKAMTGHQINWTQAFRVHVLSEFTSAVTPTAVGGSGLVVLFLNKEGISAAKSTTIMLANLILDELFFVLVCPVIFLIIPVREVFNSTTILAGTIETVFWVIYVILCIWTLFLFIILFIRPNWISKIVILLFKIPFLRRWQNKIDTFSHQLHDASADFRNKPIQFWIIAFIATVLSWSSRFLVVNALFLAFTHLGNHFVIFARQILLWLVMIASPTPGGSGLSEYAFKEYYSDIPLGTGPILVITLIWRIISYYLYLLLGAIVIPRWIDRSFRKKRISNYTSDGPFAENVTSCP